MPLLAPLISALLTGLVWLFKSRIGLFIATALAWLGLSFGTYKLAIEPAINLLVQYAQANLGNGKYGVIAIQTMGLLNIDKAVTMIISAVAAKHSITASRAFLFKKGG